jgi:hypothetical protein
MPNRVNPARTVTRERARCRDPLIGMPGRGNRRSESILGVVDVELPNPCDAEPLVLT